MRWRRRSNGPSKTSVWTAIGTARHYRSRGWRPCDPPVASVAPMRILVTGGAGYIGSHTAVLLLEAGHDVVVVDNLANSRSEAVRRIAEIAGRDVDFHQVDL